MWDTMIICWDGTVTRCCFDTKLKNVLGDANKESIKEIWTGQKYQVLRKAVLTNTFPAGSLCRGCEFWKVNFEPMAELILNGKAIMVCGNIWRRITQAS